MRGGYRSLDTDFMKWLGFFLDGRHNASVRLFVYCSFPWYCGNIHIITGFAGWDPELTWFTNTWVGSMTFLKMFIRTWRLEMLVQLIAKLNCVSHVNHVYSSNGTFPSWDAALHSSVPGIVLSLHQILVALHRMTGANGCNIWPRG